MNTNTTTMIVESALWTPQERETVLAKIRVLKAEAAAKAQATSNATPAPPNTTATTMAHSTQPKAAPRIQSEQEVKRAAAEIARQHFKTSRQPLRVMSHEQWLIEGEARSKKDGCTAIEGRKREGYLHPYLNETNPRPLGTPGAATTVKLTRQQLADKSAAWAKAKGIPIIQAIREMGAA